MDSMGEGRVRSLSWKERGCSEAGQVGEAILHLAGFAVAGIEMNELKPLDGGADPVALLFLLDNARDLSLAAQGDGPASHGLERQVQHELDRHPNFPFPGHGKVQPAAAHVLRMRGNPFGGLLSGLDFAGEIDGITPKSPLLLAGNCAGW